MILQFVVHTKYGRYSRWANKGLPELGGTVMWTQRDILPPLNHPIDRFKVGLWMKVHLHGNHETPRGKKEKYWERASKRMEQHHPHFRFQREWN